MRTILLALATLFSALPAHAQSLSADDLTGRTIERRAVEAVIWGMPAVNFDLLYQAMAEAKGSWRPGYRPRPIRSAVNAGGAAQSHGATAFGKSCFLIPCSV